MVRAILGALGAAVLMFIWGFLFWTVLPTGNLMVGALPGEQQVMTVLREQNVATGVYYLPAPQHGSEMGTASEGFMAAHEAGPLVHLFVHAEGAPALDVAVLVWGFVHFLVAAFVAAILLSLAAPQLPGYLGRTGFVVLLGAFAAFTADVGDAIWFYHPWGHEWGSFGYTVVGWLLAGLVLAALIRPRAGSA